MQEAIWAKFFEKYYTDFASLNGPMLVSPGVDINSGFCYNHDRLTKMWAEVLEFPSLQEILLQFNRMNRLETESSTAFHTDSKYNLMHKYDINLCPKDYYLEHGPLGSANSVKTVCRVEDFKLKPYAYLVTLLKKRLPLKKKPTRKYLASIILAFVIDYKDHDVTRKVTKRSASPRSYYGRRPVIASTSDNKYRGRTLLFNQPFFAMDDGEILEADTEVINVPGDIIPEQNVLINNQNSQVMNSFKSPGFNSMSIPGYHGDTNSENELSPGDDIFDFHVDNYVRDPFDN